MDLELPGGCVALVGPNGAGKSSLLRVLAGGLRLQGRVAHRGRVLSDAAQGIHLPPQARGLGYLPQQARLFPHLGVLDNVAFGAPGGREPRRERAHQELAGLELLHLLDHPTRGLSGGEAQGVALARALATDPELLLLDEPTAALDVEAKAAMRTHLGRVMQERDCVVITHDPRDLLVWSPSLVLVQGGRARSVGDIEAARGLDSAFLRELLGWGGPLL